MSYLYVTEQGSKVSFSGNRFRVGNSEELTSIPAETLESIELFGNVQMTTQCVKTCITRGIPIALYSTKGKYFGRIISTNHVNTHRQRLQCSLYEDEQFKLGFSKKIIDAKIHNQVVVVKRYVKDDKILEEALSSMKILKEKVWEAQTIEEIMGYEGSAARVYFQALNSAVEDDFKFDRRTRKPPMDEFNSLLSLGYSIVLNEIFGKIEGKGLNPFFGIMHKDREKHPALASDLLEEWRPVLIDTLVMGMISKHEIKIDDFYKDKESGGVFLSQKGFKIYIEKVEKRLRSKQKYLGDQENSFSFRRAIDKQVRKFVDAIEKNNYIIYDPILIR